MIDQGFDYLKSLETEWPLLRYVKNYENTIHDLQETAKFFRNFETVIVLGTGGSSLGGQSLVSLISFKKNHSKPKMLFLDNIDSSHFSEILSLNPASVGILVISKSGNTSETIMQLLTILQAWDNILNVSSQIRVITENSDNAIHNIAQHYNIPVIYHPQDVGGRFSIFTCVGLLPALICDIDVASFCRGAWESYLSAIELIDQSSPIAMAQHYMACIASGINQHVLIIYSDALKKMGEWFCQLWGESLGKKNIDGKPMGSTPIHVVGAVYQHSQLQLYLDGPADKFFTFITSIYQCGMPVLRDVPINHKNINFMVGKEMGQLMIAQQKAAITVMRDQNKPLRHIQLDKIDTYNIGVVMMNMMLEVLLIAKYQNINPFDQPAVELCKFKTQSYMLET